MRNLLEQIRSAVRNGQLAVSDHADERLRERGLMRWQVIAGLEGARLLTERPDDTPNPSIEVEQLLPDGTAIKVVWAFVKHGGFAKLVTVHFFDW